VKRIDFAKLSTEQPLPLSRTIDRMPVEKILALMNREDRSVPRAVWKEKNRIARAVALLVRSLQSGGRLFFAGAGTSGRLGVIEAAECPPTFGTPPSMVQAAMAGGRRAVFRSREGAEDKRGEGMRLAARKLRKGDVLVGIAASGVTPFVRAALEGAKKKGACTILVTCNCRASVGRRVDCVIAPRVGSEVIAGSTRLKAGTATKLVLNMLTVAAMVRLGKVYRNWMVDLQPKSRKLRARALRIISNLGGVPLRRAKKLLSAARNRVKVAILMARRGLNYEQAVGTLKRASGRLHDALSK
jgi:N-acetylmuramic acid 6-phosphate etherase